MRPGRVSMTWPLNSSSRRLTRSQGVEAGFAHGGGPVNLRPLFFYSEMHVKMMSDNLRLRCQGQPSRVSITQTALCPTSAALEAGPRSLNSGPPSGVATASSGLCAVLRACASELKTATPRKNDPITEFTKPSVKQMMLARPAGS